MQDQEGAGLRGKKVLVTGADGFIGSHLVEHLVGLGADVRALVIYGSQGSWGWLDGAPEEVKNSLDVVLGDVRDGGCVRAAMEGVDVVLHLAALIAIPYSYRAPESYVDTNVKGTLNVLQAVRDLGVSRMVHTSTSEVYGTARSVPMTEAHPLQGQSPYSASKIAADQMAYSFHASFETPVTILRPFNTYGPRQSARAVIPTIISQLAAGARTIQLGALEPTRDFSFVEDTARAFVAAATSDAALGQTVHVGSGFEISIGELAELIAEVMGVECKVEQDPARMRPPGSEVERLYADASYAREIMGWEPLYGGRDGLARGLERTAAWFRDSANLARYRVGDYVV